MTLDKPYRPKYAEKSDGTFLFLRRYFGSFETIRLGGCYGTRVVALAHRHSTTDYSSDLAVWRPARLILPGDACW
jgi:hypothetical protein